MGGGGSAKGQREEGGEVNRISIRAGWEEWNRGNREGKEGERKGREEKMLMEKSE